jgi:uncharacterized RmlC-like cupin family protein
MMNQFIGLALSPSMAAMAPPPLPRSEAGKRLGWHTDATEETQYIIAGTGELHMEDGNICRVGPGSVFAIPTPVKHDLVNVGKETLRAVAFFAAAMFTQNFDNVMMPPKSHILGTPNREG